MPDASITAESLYSADPAAVFAYLTKSLGTQGFIVSGRTLEIDLPASGQIAGVVRHRVEAFAIPSVVRARTGVTHVRPDGRGETLCGLAANALEEDAELDKVSCAECRVKAMAVETAFPLGSSAAAGRPLQSPPVVEYLATLRAKAPQALDRAHDVLAWADTRQIAPTYQPKKSELRFRAAPIRARGGEGASLFTLISSNGGVTVLLKHLLAQRPFRDDRIASDDLVSRLTGAASRWTRAPSDRNFPHVRLAQMTAEELDALLDVFDWIMDRLRAF
jgi:hypothetical protein